MSIKKVWVEKYRPRSVASVIMPNQRLRKTFSEWVAAGQIPNILMFGGPGTGKSSLSLALLRDLGVEKVDTLKINCSDEKIDALRDKVKGFATTMPAGNFKVVRLEECDRLGQDAQGLLRDLIETTSGSCRFIGTCNYINLLTPPLRSRFQEFQISAPAREDVAVLAAEILETEKVKFDIDDIDRVLAAAYPDVRKIIQLLEANSSDGQLSLGSNADVSDWKLDLLPALEAGDLKTARKIVCESATIEELQDVYRFLYDNLHRVKRLEKKLDEAIVLLAEYQYKHAFAADKEINVAALFCELSIV